MSKKIARTHDYYLLLINLIPLLLTTRVHLLLTSRVHLLMIKAGCLLLIKRVTSSAVKWNGIPCCEME